MSSGVPANQEVVEKYNKLKLASSSSPRYLQLAIVNNEIVVEKEGSRSGDCEADFNNLYKDITSTFANEPRFIIFDFEAKISETEGSRTKMVFIMWNPDSAPIKKKMLASSSKAGLKTAMSASGDLDFQCTAADELNWGELKNKVLKDK
eukprot:TRINITY_DN4781_c0_g1_i2.p1 TRINITY_DN4781_c0_g1~~TRINITY_DN4781_c0_g1_i2.p1  ORF type:complete len:149 (-),score=32.34 TRINITY_DN4781_c0_g1_i2:71-517(-)